MFNIQETHIESEEQLPNFVNTYSHLYNFKKTFSSTGDIFSGILICIRKTEVVLVSEIIENGRLLYIKIKNEASNTIKIFFPIYCNQNDPTKQKNLLKKCKKRF